MPAEARLDVSIDGGIALLVLRHPPANRLTRGLVRDLALRFADLEKDDAARVVIVTGQGDFCGGLDPDEWGSLAPKEAQEEIQRGFEALWSLEHLSKPSIAAISGRCDGAGAELALACDLRIASESASLAFPQVDVGWMPSHGGTARLARVVGRSTALEILLTGKRLKALDALRLGAVDHLTPPGEALDHAKALAKTIASKPRAAVRAIKRTLTEGEEKPYRNRFLLESQYSVQLLWTEDYKEAVARHAAERA